MKLDSEFVKLPFRFDVEQLTKEINQFQEKEWQSHPGRHIGNSALPLISYGGNTNDDFSGRMKETPYLEKSKYIRQIFSNFGEVFSRSRLMRLSGKCEVPIHVDAIYHWHRHVRIHIPIITNENVIFHCGNQAINMKAGECWLFDSWRNHKVVNHSNETRIHLVMDTSGSSRFWEMVENEQKFLKKNKHYSQPKEIHFLPNEEGKVLLEKYNLTPVLSPGEVDGLVEDIIEDITNNQGNELLKAEVVSKIMLNFCRDWRMLFSLWGYEKDGVFQYLQLLNRTKEKLMQFEFDVQVRNGQSSKTVLFARVFSAAISPVVRSDFENALASYRN